MVQRLSVRTLAGLLISAVFLLSTAVDSRAQQAPPVRTQGLTFTGAINDPARDVGLMAQLFVPRSVARIRAVVVVMHQGIMSERLFFGEGLRSMAAASDTAVALVFVGSMSGPQPNRTPAEDVGRNAETGSGDALLRVMDEFAAETDRGELRAAPLLFWGFSAAAGFGTTFGVLHPERTVGFVRYHTHRQGSPDDLDGLLGIPALLISGGKDTPARQQDAEEMWKTGRAAGAPWTVAVEREAQHSSPEVGDATARDLAIPWMAAVLRARLAPDGRLRPVSSDGAFLADLAIGAVSPFATFSGDRRLANWLPDERTAAGWKIVVSPAR